MLKECCLKDVNISRRWGTPNNGASARNNNQPTSSASNTRAPQRPRGRVVRAVGRGRGSGVIVGARPLVPASVVPEDLINQVGDKLVIQN